MKYRLIKKHDDFGGAFFVIQSQKKGENWWPIFTCMTLKEAQAKFDDLTDAKIEVLAEKELEPN